MELEQFISKTLISIYKGMRAANQGVKAEDDRPRFMIEPASWYEDRAKGCIDFDLAVTASNRSSKEGGAGLKILAFNLNGSKNTNISDQTVSRIRFKIAPSVTVS